MALMHTPLQQIIPVADGDWYLVSEMPVIDPDNGQLEEGPRYQPGVSLYEQYPQALAALNTVPPYSSASAIAVG